MGLDNYWTPNGTDWDSADPIKLDFDPPLDLQHGMFSGTGSGSFRGSCYLNLLYILTGVEISADIVSNHQIQLMARTLEETSYEEAMEIYESTPGVVDVHPDITRQEYRDLQRMFRSYADAGAQLEGWW